MKKIMSGFLAIAMISTFVQPIYALESLPVGQTNIVSEETIEKLVEAIETEEGLESSQESVLEEADTEETKNEAKTEDASEETKKEVKTENASKETEEYIGEVRVVLQSALDVNRNLSFEVNLSNQKGQKISLPSSDVAGQQASAVFSDLKPGKYTLTVKGDGFGLYSQDITVEDQVYTVNLLTGFLKGFSYEKGSSHPGVLLIGDVDRDGDIDDTDRKILIDAIHTGSYTKETDLNGDGQTDLADLEYFTKGYKEKSVQASVIKTISTKKIDVEVAPQTKVKGTLSNILNNEGTIQLGRTNGEEISKEGVAKLSN